MRTEIVRKEDTVIIKLEGEFDLESAQGFSSAVSDLQWEDFDKILVDLGAVTFMDSSGLGALLSRYRDVTAAGKDFVITAPSHTIREILGISGLNRVVDIYPDVETALDSDGKEETESDG